MLMIYLSMIIIYTYIFFPRSTVSSSLVHHILVYQDRMSSFYNPLHTNIPHIHHNEIVCEILHVILTWWNTSLVTKYVLWCNFYKGTYIQNVLRCFSFTACDFCNWDLACFCSCIDSKWRHKLRNMYRVWCICKFYLAQLCTFRILSARAPTRPFHFEHEWCFVALLRLGRSLYLVVCCLLLKCWYLFLICNTLVNIAGRTTSPSARGSFSTNSAFSTLNFSHNSIRWSGFLHAYVRVSISFSEIRTFSAAALKEMLRCCKENKNNINMYGLYTLSLVTPPWWEVLYLFPDVS